MSHYSTASVHVRALQVDDRSRWDELWQAYLEFYQEQLPPAVSELTWRRLMENSQLHGVAASDSNGRLIGFAHYFFHVSTWSVNGYCYLEDLFVDPLSRGRHAGRSLIEAVYRAADERGANRVYWHTENTNARAQVLYNQVARLTPFVQYRRNPSSS